LDANRFTEEELKGSLEGMAIEAIASETKPEAIEWEQSFS
jgi:hypothetical protein